MNACSKRLEKTLADRNWLHDGERGRSAPRSSSSWMLRCTFAPRGDRVVAAPPQPAPRVPAPAPPPAAPALAKFSDCFHQLVFHASESASRARCCASSSRSFPSVSSAKSSESSFPLSPLHYSARLDLFFFLYCRAARAASCVSSPSSSPPPSSHVRVVCVPRPPPRAECPRRCTTLPLPAAPRLSSPRSRPACWTTARWVT